VSRPRRLLAWLVALAAGLAMVATALGPDAIAWADVVAIVLRGPPTGAEVGDLASETVWSLRLPRVLLALVVGGALAVAGALTQAVFRNPLADPSVLGISVGAALVAVIGLWLGLDRAGLWVTPVLAGMGAVSTLLLLLAIARTVDDPVTLLLAGVALGAAFGAATTGVLAIASDRHDLGIKVVRWLMGSFEARSWGHLDAAALPILVGVAIATASIRDLDALALGDDVAASLGAAPERVRRRAVVAVALLVGPATAVAGVLGFVGLVVPHVVRRWVGPGHRALLPISAAGGALVMLAVDTMSRAGWIALPPGVVASLFGAPAFLWILMHSARRGMR
jgi:iron complex transport system permease protein